MDARRLRTLALGALGVFLSTAGLARRALADDCSALVHAASISARDVRWESRIRCWSPTQGAGIVRFAYPLPDGSRLETVGATAVLESGRIVGATLPVDAVRPDGTVRLLTRMPRSAARARLVAPLLNGSRPQLVGLVGRELEFEPDAEYERRIGASRLTYLGDVDGDVARESRRIAREVGVEGDRFVVCADANIVERGGIVGEIDSRTHRYRGLRTVLGALVVLCVAGFAYVYGRLRRRAELEEAEAMLHREYEALDAELAGRSDALG